MASERSFSTPVAVLLGSVIIALAVIFGPLIRSTSNDPAAPAPSASAGPAAPPNPPPQAAPIAPADAPSPGTAAVSREAVIAEVVKALEQRRKEIVDRCWKPAVAANPDPPTTKLTFDFTFDAAGNLTARGAREARGRARPEIRECLDDIVKLITISPPGGAVQVEVPLTLP
jgi:hypothetical protein